MLFKTYFVALLLLLVNPFGFPRATAHGGVALVDDVCVMSLGNLAAHFSSYQPATRQSKEFCEDIPDISASVFVIDFIHDVLATMPVDFRIVRDVNNVGLSATWDDLQAIDDLEAATVFYRPAQRYAGGSMNLRHQFTDGGNYIGVVTAFHAAKDTRYRAVFPFRVGAKDFWDYLPVFLGLLLFLEVFYWVSSGGLQRFNSKSGAISSSAIKPQVDTRRSESVTKPV